MSQQELPHISDINELVMLAQHLEHQAVINYERLAEEMRRHKNTDTANLFMKLAEDERAHESAFAKIIGKPNDKPTAQLWEFPAEMKLHGDAGDPFLLMPYNAICFALYNEAKTFELFTQIAARADDDELRIMAESFAKEELSHIAALRLARLDANRNLREMRDQLGWWDDIDKIKNIDDFVQALSRMESTTAFIYNDASARLKKIGDNETSDFFNKLSERVRKSLVSLNAENMSNGSFSLKGMETSAAILLACLKYTDQTLDFVTFIAEKSEINEIYVQSSEMTERLTSRLNIIRERLELLFDV